MTISTRLAVAFCAPLLAAAQPPVAPPPHLALDELVKEYKRLGLPLPPANAELVRIERGHLRIPDPGARLLGTGPRQDPTRHERYLNDIRELSEHPRLLAYRVPPPKPGGPTRYLAVGWFGVGLLDFEGPEREWAAEARPDSGALRWVPA